MTAHQPANAFLLPKSHGPTRSSQAYNAFKRLFIQYGAVILRSRLAGLSAFSSPVALWAKELVEILVDMEGSGAEAVRDAYAADICASIAVNLRERAYDAIVLDSNWVGRYDSQKLEFDKSAEHFPHLLPAAAAAVGNVELFQATIAPAFDPLEAAYPFKSALTAAAATGKTKVMEKVFGQLSVALDADATSGNLRVTTKVAAPLYDALRACIHASRPAAAEAIYDFLLRTQNQCLDKYIASRKEKLMRLCIEYGEPRTADCVIGFIGGGKFSIALCQYLFSHGDGSVLRLLIEKGYIDPNMAKCFVDHSHLSTTTPLAVELNANCIHLFETLLSGGADIDGTPDIHLGVSLLWHAANAGNEDRVKFLLGHGADPESHEDWRSPLQVAKERGRAEITDMLLEAKQARGGGTEM